MFPSNDRGTQTSTLGQDIVSAFLLFGMIVSGTGLAIALAGLFCSYFDLYPFGERVMSVLVPGIFAVWFPTVILGIFISRNGKQRDFWKIALSGCPQPMRVGLWALCGFGAANFIYFVVMNKNAEGTSRAVQTAGGHLLIFYGIAFCVMFSVYRRPRLLQNVRCPNGHSVSATDTYCPQCGAAIEGQTTPA